jgi:hypothetical protein
MDKGIVWIIGWVDVFATIIASIFCGIPATVSVLVGVPSLVLVVLFGFMIDENSVPRHRSR